jgi:subtilisin family serine protease
VHRNSAKEVVVAVIDTGVKYTHEDLKMNMWKNPGESGDGKESNGVDDDGNGYVDDVYGIDAYLNTGNPVDECGHGTHVAGIIGAVGNNGAIGSNDGVVGVAWFARIMALRISGTGPNLCLVNLPDAAIEALDYAIDRGAHVINASWGTTANQQALADAIRVAASAGIPFVAAAGNSGNNYPAFPARFHLENVVAVIATTKNDARAGYSDYGLVMTDLGAPGGDATNPIYSIWATSDTAYATNSGTSMAAAHVSGGLAMLKAQFPAQSYLQHINRLFSSVDRLSALNGLCQTGGRLNLYRALTSSSSQPANDTFGSSAYTLDYVSPTTSTISATANNIDATKETGEPNHAGNTGGRSIWWNFTPSSQTAGTTTLITKGSTFPTLLAVYTGNSVSSLTQVPGASSSVSDACSYCKVTFTATAGTTYRIAVDGYTGASGIVRLQMEKGSGSPVLTLRFDPATITRYRSQTNFHFQVTGPPSSSYQVWRASSLSDPNTGVWANIGSVNLSSQGVRTFDDSGAAVGMRFYRLKDSINITFSCNTIGYLDLTVPNGWSMKANPFNASDNRISLLLPNSATETTVNNGTLVYKWNEVTQAYVLNSYDSGLGGWADPNMTIAPGEGFLVQSSGTQTWTFVGEVMEGALPQSVPGLYSIRSSKAPLAMLISSGLNLPVVTGDVITRMVSGAYVTYAYHNGLWSPSEPLIAEGESFWIYRPATWLKVFKVWPYYYP